ncbi:pH-response regulator [Ramaria rubella]|nr:pH-response regulator [Ramaria rubella]
MPNQLTLSFKSTSTVPLRSALREYIQTAHTETHPDAFKWDINQWESMRKEATSNVVHVGTTEKVIAYQAQLVFILTKLPADINLPIPYSRAFSQNAPPLTLSNLAYERANVLYNLAVLYCRLATSEDRSNGEGIKRAVAHFQNAAGTLSHLMACALPSLKNSLPPNTALPYDLSEPFLQALERLMLAQAQECFWLGASLKDTVKNLLLSKLSFKTSLLYRDTLDAMESDSATSALFPHEWISHVRIKSHHFLAAALYRKSVDDLESNRYGEELARLDIARVEAKKGLEVARKGNIARAVQDDIKSLYETLETSYKRAERDNDLIYHHTVPSTSSVLPLQELKDVAPGVIPFGLKDPKTVVKEDETILGELVGWGVRVAVDIYRERRNDWVQLEIVERAAQLDAAYTSMLRSLNLPATLDALDRPIGLPPSLLGKAEEVRLEDGMNRIPMLLDDVRRLTRRNSAALDEILDILDQEATEDEEIRTAYRVDVWERPVSHEANRELTDQITRYRDVLARAMESDREISEKWEKWADQIKVLCWTESEIERSVPSSTVSSVSGGGSKSTQGHARVLRSYLESLEDLVHTRTELVRRIKRLADADDVAPRFMRDAAAVARWVEVRPEIFEQAIEEELAKYDRWRDELEEGARRQEEALQEVQERNVLFLESRREDPSVKVRERALQGLDLAYHEYRDIHRHLTGGIKYYNDFAALLAPLREKCKAWVLQRRKDVEWLMQSLNAMSIQAEDPQQRSHNSRPPETERKLPSHATSPQPNAPSATLAPTHAPIPALAPGPVPTPTKHDLPSLDSDTWQTSAVPQPAFTRSNVTPAPRNDFALDLPPPDSAAWETIPIPVKATRKTKTRRK